MITITSNGKDLLESKTFLALDLGDTTVCIGDGPERLNFILEFIEEKDKKQDIEYIPIDDNTLRLRLTNWNNSLGTTLINPLEVGTFMKRKLYLAFYVKKAGEKGQLREITFSVYLGEGIQDGEN